MHPQARFLALIACAEAYKSAHQTLADHIASLRRAVLNGSLSPATAWSAVDGAALATQWIDPIHLSTLANEKAHYRANAKRNDRERVRQRAKRASSGPTGAVEMTIIPTPTNPIHTTLLSRQELETLNAQAQAQAAMDNE